MILIKLMEFLLPYIQGFSRIKMMKKALLFLISLFSMVYGNEETFPSNPRIKAKFHAIDPKSVAQNFAFYELYPETKEGRDALVRAWNLLSLGSENKEEILPDLPKIDIQPLISLINYQSSNPPDLSQDQFSLIRKLASHLKNRKLKGYGMWDEKEILALEPKEIDLSRALFLAQYGTSDEAKKKIEFYEAAIDLMALQILAHLSPNPKPLDIIRTMNDFIFHELRFRFPPHSLYAKDIDLYTFLPSVIDSRKGVCLGVSILYLCLAQRIDLSLEAITPPGHIYVRYKEKEGEERNIETTARGIHVPSSMYMGMEAKKLQVRDIKEVIGLAFINQASVSWMREDYQTAVNLYEKALPYLPKDYLLKLLLGYNYLFVGKEKEGKALLKEIKDAIPEHALQSDNVTEDYLAGKTDAESMKVLFLPVDETRESIIAKQKKLESILVKYPQFRAALLSLASSHMQLGREKEALQVLKFYHAVDDKDPVVNYYLAAIYLQRYDYEESWKHLEQAEKILKEKHHSAEPLKQVRRALQTVSPKKMNF